MASELAIYYTPMHFMWGVKSGATPVLSGSIIFLKAEMKLHDITNAKINAHSLEIYTWIIRRFEFHLIVFSQ